MTNNPETAERQYKVNYSLPVLNKSGCFLVTTAKNEEEARENTRRHIKQFYSGYLPRKTEELPVIEINLGELPYAD